MATPKRISALFGITGVGGGLELNHLRNNYCNKEYNNRDILMN
jgi:hypothetical protein